MNTQQKIEKAARAFLKVQKQLEEIKKETGLEVGFKDWDLERNDIEICTSKVVNERIVFVNPTGWVSF